MAHVSLRNAALPQIPAPMASPLLRWQARLKEAKLEEPGFPRHIIAGAFVIVTGNFIMMLNWLGG